MPNAVDLQKNDVEFQDRMKERYEQANQEESATMFNAERLNEMNKRLPDWDLEPPFNFLK